MYQFFDFLIQFPKEKEYCGDRKKMIIRRNKNMIATDSNDAQIIADCVENSGSID